MSFVERDGAAIWYDVQGDGEPVTLIGGDIMPPTSSITCSRRS